MLFKGDISMHVITLINGSLSSQTSSIYALNYAKQSNLPLYILHVKGKDSLEEVQKSADDLFALAQEKDVESNFTIFDTLEELTTFIEQKDIDMIFCSTRYRHALFDPSFVQTLIHKKLKVDFAIVKVLNTGYANRVENVVLPIRSSKLSVKKFTLFSTFVLAYNAKAEIYSIDKIYKSSFFEKKETTRLKELIFHLRHYFRLANMLNFKLSLKHDFAYGEGEMVRSHIGRNRFDLTIVGAHTSSSFFFSHPIDTLFEDPLINTVYFIPYEEK